MMIDVTGRHSSVAAIVRFFDYEHLTHGDLREISKRCHDLVVEMVQALPDGPELTAGLRKLLEAKDCLVRAAL